jgi:hypothetical protein
MKDWKAFEKEAKMKKAIRAKLLLLGKKVRRKGRKSWEEGTIVIDTFDNEDLEYFIMFKEDDMEQVIGLPFQVWNETENRWEDDDDYDVIVRLTDEEKEFLDIHQNLPFKSL